MNARRGEMRCRYHDASTQMTAGETSTPSLSGFSFFRIAVDPANREHCVAATSNGLYERIPSGAGFTWTRRRTGVQPWERSLRNRQPKERAELVPSVTGGDVHFQQVAWAAGEIAAHIAAFVENALF